MRITGQALCLAGAFSLALAGPARPAAANQLDHAATFAEAEQACISGNWQKGVELLAKLYLETRKPAYLHNQARCYEQNGQLELAMGRYEEFLRKDKEQPPEKRSPLEKRNEAERTIARIEERLMRQKAARDRGERPEDSTAAAPTPGPAPLPPATNSSPTPYPGAGPAIAAAPRNWNEPSPRVDLQTTRPANGGSAGLRIAGISAAASGGVALLIGAMAGVMTKTTQDGIEDDARNRRPHDPDAFDTGKKSAQIATIGFIAGPALLGAGALLYYLGMAKAEDRPSDATAIAITPMVAKSGALLQIGGRY
jgi:hypothetical protein